MTNPTSYPLSAARALSLHTQGLTTPNGAETQPIIHTLLETIEQLGCVQIDTLQMVHRSHYVILWSRLGTYNPADLDKLLYDPDHRHCFEYWFQAACILPYSQYPNLLPVMRRHKERYYDSNHRWGQWMARDGHAELTAAVYERIRQEGPLRGRDFEYTGPQRAGWWDWKPSKIALEALYDMGDLMVANRINFQRVYDLRQRVLPPWVDTTEPPWEQVARTVLGRSLKAIGVCAADPGQILDYCPNLGRPLLRPFVKTLLDDGTIVQIQITFDDGDIRPMFIHRDNLPLLQQAADNALPTPRTTFLNPFDALFYPTGRDQLFWNFFHTLECYKPEPQRRWGYFSLPILHRDKLVGRFDPKLERKTKTLRLKAIHLEPGVEPTAELAAGVATAMHDFLTFHNATDLIVEKSNPPAFAESLQRAM
jgi:uncharacterized protein YcaQ